MDPWSVDHELPRRTVTSLCLGGLLTRSQFFYNSSIGSTSVRLEEVFFFKRVRCVQNYTFTIVYLAQDSFDIQQFKVSLHRKYLNIFLFFELLNRPINIIFTSSLQHPLWNKWFGEFKCVTK